MTDYNPIQFRMAIDNVLEAKAHVQLANGNLVGAIFEADCSDEEDDIVCEITAKLIAIKKELKEVTKMMEGLKK